MLLYKSSNQLFVNFLHSTQLTEVEKMKMQYMQIKKERESLLKEIEENDRKLKLSEVLYNVLLAKCNIYILLKILFMDMDIYIQIVQR